MQTSSAPPQGMRAASLKEVRADSTTLASSRWSSALTAVSASAAAVFMCTTVPSRALPCARVHNNAQCVGSVVGGLMPSGTGSRRDRDVHHRAQPRPALRACSGAGSGPTACQHDG